MVALTEKKVLRMECVVCLGITFFVVLRGPKRGSWIRYLGLFSFVVFVCGLSC